jgi:tetratricopeptide (TPR) repeat protein
VPGAAAAIAVAGLGLADGGIAPPAWGWAGLGLAAVAVAALAFRLRVRLSRLELAFLGALGLVAAWAALSAAWSRSLPSSVLESQRLLVYAAAAAAFLLAGRRAAAGPLLVGTLAGILVVAAANVLLRDGDAVSAAGSARPLADEHALAILLVLGVAIALGLALAAARPRGRIAAAVAAGFLVVPLVPLGSRGAWLALAAGLVAAGALRFARTPLAYPAAVALGLVVAIVAGVRFDPQREELWRVASDEARSEPLAGTGAGTYPRVWLQQRSDAVQEDDAHNVYLETLAEVGPLGLALLAAALAVPVAAAASVRHEPLAPAAASAYAAFLVHAGIDRDWAVPAVVVAALAAAAALLLLARPRAPAAIVGHRLRLALVLWATAVGLAALVGLVGNTAVAQAEDAAAGGSWVDAETRARQATWLAPWSAVALRLRGEAQYARGDVEAARRSLRRAVARDPSDPELWLALANSLRGNARARALAQALRLNPLGIAPG